MQNLFVYGTLKDPKVQKEVIGREVEAKEDILKGYSKGEIIIEGKIYPILVKGTGEISGLVLQVTNEELKKLDEYETAAYRRIEEKLKSGITAWVYVK